MSQFSVTSITPGSIIQLTKLRSTDKPHALPGNWDSYRLGMADNKDSLPVDYTLVGYLLTPIAVGCRVRVQRFVRNGEPVLGLFQSSILAFVSADGFSTLNSVYRVRCLWDPRGESIEPENLDGDPFQPGAMWLADMQRSHASNSP